MASSKVDDFWAALKKNTGPKQQVPKDNFEKLWFSFNNDVNIKDSQAIINTSVTTSQKGSNAPEAAVPVPTKNATPECVPPSALSTDEIQNALVKNIAALKDTSQQTRRRALQAIKVV